MSTMRKIFDISEFADIRTLEMVSYDLSRRFRQRRKELKITQRQLEQRSDVSYSSIRRFESTGDISLTSLLKIAKAIDSLEDFDKVFTTIKVKNLKDFKIY